MATELTRGRAPAAAEPEAGARGAAVRVRGRRLRRAGAAGVASPAEAPPAARGAAERLRHGAFEAGLIGTAAATVYALLMVLLRTTGAERIVGAILCALLLALLLVVRQDPAAAYARLRRSPALAPAAGAVLGTGLAIEGAGASLLFLPAVLLLATIGAVVPLRLVAAAGALAATGQLAAVADAGAGGATQRLALLAAAGLVAVPVALAALVMRTARGLAASPAPSSSPTPDPDAGSRLWVAIADPEPVSSAQPSSPAPTRLAGPLTPRQQQVVALTREGLRHGEIAERLGVSVHQVRRLLRQARERTGASTTRELTAWAIGAALKEIPSETETRLADD